MMILVTGLILMMHRRLQAKKIALALEVSRWRNCNDKRTTNRRYTKPIVNEMPLNKNGPLLLIKIAVTFLSRMSRIIPDRCILSRMSPIIPLNFDSQ